MTSKGDSENVGIVAYKRLGNPARIAVARLGQWLGDRGLIPRRWSAWMSQRWQHAYRYRW